MSAEAPSIHPPAIRKVERSEERAQLNPDWRVEVFYDGECPLCLREIKLLRWLDRKHRIRFTDIASADFKATEFGKTPAEFMDEIHGRLPDKNGNPARWIIGVEVFRQLYAAVGFGPLVWPTRMPGISHALDFGYRIFAKNRLRLTGRCNTETCEVNSETSHSSTQITHPHK